jgi:MFS family permease
MSTEIARAPQYEARRMILGFTSDQGRNLLLASLGSLLEFYEFMVFGFFTVVIGKLFFPPSLPESVKIFQAFALYSLGFLLRPVSGIIIGHLGDRFGRKLLFMFTMVMMAVPTALIGLTPTYASIGIAAPIILLVLRMLQGLAVAGEYAGVSVFVTEHVSKGNIGMASGLVQGAVYIGFFLGGAAGAIATNALDVSALESWGWRIPFLVGGFFGLFSVYLRRRLDETPLFLDIQRMKSREKVTPAAEIFASYRQPIVYGALLSCYLGTLITLLYFYMPVFLQTQYGADRSIMFNANALGLLCLSIMCPLWGKIADKIGFGQVLGVGAAGLTVCLMFFFESLATDGFVVMQVQWWWLAFSFFMASAAVVPAASALIFPTKVRFAGMGFAYNAGVLISATAPTMLSWIVIGYGKPAIMYYALAVGLLGVIVAIWTPRLAHYPKMD